MGLDLSLTNSGMVICRNGRVIAKRSVKTTPKTGPHEERIRLISRAVDSGFRKYRPDLVVLERAHYRATASTTPLIELAGCVKQVLWTYQAPWHSIPAKSVKKFAGSGNATKAEMIEWARQLWSGCPNDDNLADAFFLARWAFEKYDEIVS